MSVSVTDVIDEQATMRVNEGGFNKSIQSTSLGVNMRLIFNLFWGYINTENCKNA